MRLLLFATLIAATSAMFMPTQPNAGTQPQAGGASMFQGQDPNQVMMIVRQILMKIIPVLLRNPGLMAAFAGGNGGMNNGGGAPAAPSPSAPAPPVPATPPPVQPLQTPPAPPAPAPPPPPPVVPAPPPPGPSPPMTGPQTFPSAPGGFPAGNGFPGAGGFGGPPMAGPPYMGGGDAMKDLRLFDLLYDRRTGRPKDPRLSNLLQPVMPGQMPYGFSLPDIVKDQISYHYMMGPGRTSPHAREIVHLVGDPPKDMMYRFGAGTPSSETAGGMPQFPMGMTNLGAAMARAFRMPGGGMPGGPGAMPPMVGMGMGGPGGPGGQMGGFMGPTTVDYGNGHQPSWGHQPQWKK